MKTKQFNLWLAAILILVMPGWKSFAASEKFTKTIKKEFSVNSDALLSVKNKYGKIHCNNWEKMAVSIEVTITVEASNENKAQRIFDKINIDISGSNTMVEAVTTMSNIGSNNNDNENFSIDYDIYMPSSLEISLDNKFGDIFVNQVDGPATIDLGYGNMEAKRFQNASNTLSIKFSNAEIDYLKGGTVEIKYSQLDLSEAGVLNIDSKFSTLNIDMLDIAGIQSKYDSYAIGKINLINSHSEFTGFEIETLNKHAEIDTKYGGIEIGYIPSGFNDVIIDNSFADVEITFAKDASYLVDANVKFGSLDYPKNLSKITVDEEGYTENNYKGYVGVDSNPKSVVKIQTANGNVTLKAQ